MRQPPRRRERDEAKLAAAILRTRLRGAAAGVEGGDIWRRTFPSE